ncbi:cell adhesion molecule CEACAM5-like [Pagrus major]|uniref:cell adhesion molecule CEACAM5-like n=1 Tax=Pagrus major TaxID=143350 RepID=UPI003CC84F29
MFTITPTPSEKPFTIAWSSRGRNIITFRGENTTGPEYEGRITLFISTGSLELRNLTCDDSGEYTVVILPQTGAQLVGSTTLKVDGPVSNVIVTPSSKDLVEFNSSVSLSCSASGCPLSFLWLDGTSVVTESDRFQLTDGGATLTIVNVTRSDQGRFRCHVSNPVKNGTSDPVNLPINYGPENVTIKLSPPQECYKEGSEINMSCSAVSKPSALFYWFLNGNKLSHTGSEITFQISESGNYSCQAFNQKTLRYDTSSPLAVTVLESISGASVTPTNPPIEGNSVNLTCDAAAGSVFTRMWMKNDSNLALTDNITLHDGNKVLSFKSLNTADNGEYSCNISNPFSSGGATYNMVINYGPENVGITGLSEIDSGQTLTLTCTAESEPSASYTWTLNGIEIHSSSVFTKVIKELSDSGNYTCHATNKITGRTSSAVHQVTVTVIQGNSSGCSAGCIAGIVIACLVVIGAAVGGIVYYIYKRKKQPMTFSNSNTATTRGDGQINTGYSASQELNYADVTFHRNRNGGRVQLGSQNETSDYAEVKANSSAAGSTPPTYDDHMQRLKRPAPQPGGYGVNVYAQVKKN